jgi:hypothetical protein
VKAPVKHHEAVMSIEALHDEGRINMALDGERSFGAILSVAPIGRWWSAGILSSMDCDFMARDSDEPQDKERTARGQFRADQRSRLR